jgi:hypothetical protein
MIPNATRAIYYMMLNNGKFDSDCYSWFIIFSGLLSSATSQEIIETLCLRLNPANTIKVNKINLQCSPHRFRVHV